MIKIVLLVLMSIFTLSDERVDEKIDLKVKISGISKLEGDIRIAIYSTENEFCSGVDILDYRVIPADRSTVTCTFQLMEKGKYAMALIQDLNRNEDLDFNFIGFPKEPYAFSNNPGIWYRAPTFEECAVEVLGNKTIEIKM